MVGGCDTPDTVKEFEEVCRRFLKIRNLRRLGAAWKRGRFGDKPFDFQDIS
jgi:hypothetical protein